MFQNNFHLRMIWETRIQVIKILKSKNPLKTIEHSAVFLYNNN